MKPTIDLDMRQWNAAARELFQTSSRSCVDFTNGQALKVAVESVRQTEKANRLKIAYILGVVGRASEKKIVSRGKNKGKIRFKLGKYQTVVDSFASRILGKRFKETGEWGVKGETMADRVQNFIASRMRSASFIASGWIGARNALWSVVRQKPARTSGMLGAKQYGRPKGFARPARFSLRSNIVSEIENKALMDHMANVPSTGGNPMPTAIKGLQAALNVAAQDMIAELARRLNPDFKKVSAK